MASGASTGTGASTSAPPRTVLASGGEFSPGQTNPQACQLQARAQPTSRASKAAGSAVSCHQFGTKARAAGSVPALDITASPSAVGLGWGGLPSPEIQE